MLTLGFERALDEMSSGQFIAVISIVGGLLVGGVSAVFGIAYAMVKKREVEQTKREIAAYVAEGSMSADDAKKLVEAGMSDVDWAALGLSGSSKS